MAQNGQEMDPAVLDDIINRLLEFRQARTVRQVQLSEAEIRQLCNVSREIFLQQPNLLELEAPIKICGNFFSISFACLLFVSVCLLWVSVANLRHFDACCEISCMWVMCALRVCACILCVSKILRSCREIWRKVAMLIGAWQCQVFFLYSLNFPVCFPSGYVSEGIKAHNRFKS